MTRRPSRVLERSSRVAFRTAAKLRRAPAFHPVGTTFAGDAEVDERSGLATAATSQAVVRLSRGIGWDERLPDFHGVAIRFVDAHGPDRHQDLLLTSAGSGPLSAHLLRPTRRFDTGGCSSVLPYRRASGRVVFRCAPLDVGRLVDAPRAVPFVVTLQAAAPLRGWEDVAQVHVVRHAPDLHGVRFDPWNTGPDLHPAGPFNLARRGAYTGSREGAAAMRDAQERARPADGRR